MAYDKEKLASAISRAGKVSELDREPDRTDMRKPSVVGLQEAMRKLGAALAAEDAPRAAEAFRDAFNICDGYGDDGE